MAISYVEIARTPYVFRQLTGLTTSEFEKIVAISEGQSHKKQSLRLH